MSVEPCGHVLVGPRGDRRDGASIRTHEESGDLVKCPEVELAGLRSCLGLLFIPRRAAAAAASAEARKAVGEFAIGVMLLNGGKGQLYGVGVVQSTTNPFRNAFLA